MKDFFSLRVEEIFLNKLFNFSKKIMFFMLDILYKINFLLLDFI